MYIYKTTAINTGKFYIATSHEDARLPRANDPMGLFSENVSNGQYMSNNIESQILHKTTNIDKLREAFNWQVQKYSSNPNFVGAYFTPIPKTDTEPVAEESPIVEPIVEETVEEFEEHLSEREQLLSEMMSLDEDAKLYDISTFEEE